MFVLILVIDQLSFELLGHDSVGDTWDLLVSLLLYNPIAFKYLYNEEESPSQLADHASLL
jgi:hypothetical protein